MKALACKLVSLRACQLDSLLAKLNRRDRPDQCQKNRPDPAAATVKGRLLLLQLKVTTDVDVDMHMLKSSKRNRKVSHARAVISYLAVNELGCRASEVARKLRISGMAVGKCVESGKKLLDKS